MNKQNIRWTSSPWGFRQYDFAAYCDFMKAQKINDICVLLGSETGLPLAIPCELNKLQAVVLTARDKGLHIVEAAALNGSHADNLKACHVLGCDFYRICGVFNDSSVARAQLISELILAGNRAAEYGITIILENHGGLLASASACREILEEIGRANVRLNFDAANFAYYGQCPYEAWTELKDLTAFTHLKNLTFYGGTPHYCRVVAGVIDYDRLFSEFGNYNGFLCVEYEEPEDVEHGTADDLKSLRETWRKHEK